MSLSALKNHKKKDKGKNLFTRWVKTEKSLNKLKTNCCEACQKVVEVYWIMNLSLPLLNRQKESQCRFHRIFKKDKLLHKKLSKHVKPIPRSQSEGLYCSLRWSALLESVKCISTVWALTWSSLITVWEMLNKIQCYKQDSDQLSINLL